MACKKESEPRWAFEIYAQTFIVRFSAKENITAYTYSYIPKELF